MNQRKVPEPFLGNYIGGEFVLDSKEPSWKIFSPSDLDDLIIEGNSPESHVDEACSQAKKAFKPWNHLSLEKRKEKLLHLKEIYQNSTEKTALLISRETGKPLWESRQEASALAQKISITLEHSLKLVETEEVNDVFPGVKGYIRYQARGVMAVIGPFNFPLHLPNGHIVPALLMGNTVVFKPSDKTPLTGQWLSQMIHEAGFPPGVFNMIQGSSEVGKKLVKNKSISGILFTGSYAKGKKIQSQILKEDKKILALELGGKNSSLVWKDASLEKALYENTLGAFLTTGQRCSSTSKLILHQEIFDTFLSSFLKVVKNLKIGHWSDEPFMGPLIDKASIERHFHFQNLGLKEGGEILLKGEPLDSLQQPKGLSSKRSVKGHYVSPSLIFFKNQSSHSHYQNEEIFTPSLAIYCIHNFEEALNIIHSSGYGLAVSCFSKNPDIYKKALKDVQAGLIHWNRSTAGASSRLAFGGRGRSGNDRPSGHLAIQSCVVPVSSLEDKSPASLTKAPPGMNFKI